MAEYCLGLQAEAEAQGAEVLDYKVGLHLKPEQRGDERALGKAVEKAIDNAIRDGAAVIINSVSTAQLEHLSPAIEAGLRIIHSGGSPPAADTLEKTRSAAIRQDDRHLGELLALWTAEAVRKQQQKGVFRNGVLVLRFQKGADTEYAGDPDGTRMRRFLTILDQKCKHIKIKQVSLVAAYQQTQHSVRHLVREKLRECFRSREGPPYQIVVCLYGGLAIPAADTIEECGLADSVQLITADLTADILDRMYSDKVLAAACGVDAFSYGRRVMALSLAKEQALKSDNVKPFLLTRADACSGILNSLDVQRYARGLGAPSKVSGKS